MWAPVAFPGTAMRESEVRNVLRFEVVHEPDAFRLVRADCYVNTSAVVETHGAMDGGFAVGADRERPGKFRHVGHLHGLEVGAGEDAIACILRIDFAGPFGVSLRLGFETGQALLKPHGFRDLLDELGARDGELQLRLGTLDIGRGGLGFSAGNNAGVDQLLGL